MATLLIVGLILFATPAEAHFGSRVQDARSIASQRFPDHCRQVSVPRAHVFMGNHLAWTDGEACKVWLAPGFHHLSWAVRCTALVHEYGHLSGRVHSPNPASIMYGAPSPFRAC